jgi:hypothetical protein
MLLKMFSIYDEKAVAHVTPFFMHNEMMALRQFKNMCFDKNSQIGTNPEDYSLWCVGEFDDSTGEVIAERNLILAGNSISHEISNAT